jgi:hypothetical protein
MVVVGVQALCALPEHWVAVGKGVNSPVQHYAFSYTVRKTLGFTPVYAIGHKIADLYHIVIAGKVYMCKEVHSPIYHYFRNGTSKKKSLRRCGGIFPKVLVFFLAGT